MIEVSQSCPIIKSGKSCQELRSWDRHSRFCGNSVTEIVNIDPGSFTIEHPDSCCRRNDGLLASEFCTALPLRNRSDFQGKCHCERSAAISLAQERPWGRRCCYGVEMAACRVASGSRVGAGLAAAASVGAAVAASVGEEAEVAAAVAAGGPRGRPGSGGGGRLGGGGRFPGCGGSFGGARGLGGGGGRRRGVAATAGDEDRGQQDSHEQGGPAHRPYRDGSREDARGVGRKGGGKGRESGKARSAAQWRHARRTAGADHGSGRRLLRDRVPGAELAGVARGPALTADAFAPTLAKRRPHDRSGSTHPPPSPGPADRTAGGACPGGGRRERAGGGERIGARPAAALPGHSLALAGHPRAHEHPRAEQQREAGGDRDGLLHAGGRAHSAGERDPPGCAGVGHAHLQPVPEHGPTAGLPGGGG